MEIDNIISSVLNGEYTADQIARIIIRNDHLESLTEHQARVIQDLRSRIDSEVAANNALYRRMTNSSSQAWED